MTLNCIAVDDEPLALNLITGYIRQTPFLSLKGSYSSAMEALPTLLTGGIQLVFLDIQMPDFSGLEFSKMLQRSQATSDFRVIFTTAYDRYAIEGYQVDALYYLLKPFNYQEFLQAALKGVNYFERHATLETASADEPYLYVKSDYKTVRIDLREITYIESLKDYVIIHLTGDAKPVKTLMSLKSIEDRLPVDRFLRIHRSFVVSMAQVHAIGKNTVHIGDQEISVGDQYREAFQRLVDRWT